MHFGSAPAVLKCALKINLPCQIKQSSLQGSLNESCTGQEVMGKGPAHRHRDWKLQIKPTSAFICVQETFGLRSQLRVTLAPGNCLPWSTELYKSAERGQPKPLLATHKALPCSQACYTLHSKRAEK